MKKQAQLRRINTMAFFLDRYNNPGRIMQKYERPKPPENLPAIVPRRKLKVIATPNRLKTIT